jgi:hypothetical protein
VYIRLAVFVFPRQAVGRDVFPTQEGSQILCFVHKRLAVSLFPKQEFASRMVPPKQSLCSLHRQLAVYVFPALPGVGVCVFCTSYKLAVPCLPSTSGWQYL